MVLRQLAVSLTYTLAHAVLLSLPSLSLLFVCVCKFKKMYYFRNMSLVSHIRNCRHFLLILTDFTESIAELFGQPS